MRRSYSSSSTSAVWRSNAGGARVGAAEFRVTAVADGQILQPSVDNEIDERRRGENAVGDQVAAEPVEHSADQRADDDDRQSDLRIEVLSDVEVSAAADRAPIDGAIGLDRVADVERSGISRPQPPHLMAAGASLGADRQTASHFGHLAMICIW